MQKLPVYLTRVRAGFPTPDEGEIEEKLNLNEHPAATFFVRLDQEREIQLKDSQKYRILRIVNCSTT